MEAITGIAFHSHNGGALLPPGNILDIICESPADALDSMKKIWRALREIVVPVDFGRHIPVSPIAGQLMLTDA